MGGARNGFGRRGDPQLLLTDPMPVLASALPVAAVANASVGTALRAAGALAEQRNGRAPRLELNRGHVVAAVQSERHFTVNDEPTGMGFAPLSRFWRTQDGWVRTHGNYAWHRQALLSALDCAEDTDAIANAMAWRSAADVENTVVAAGGIAAAVRHIDQWHAHPQGQAVGQEPLIGIEVQAGAAPRSLEPSDLPARGVRVLDLTRVIAGPVCSRYLAALGADVVRVDPPHRPDMELHAPNDTLLNKRSTILDLATAGGRTTVGRLLEEADVVVCGYRPGALERFGFTPLELTERSPGIVVVFIDAWGHTGPWSGRRGFDSVVQAPTGIAMLESADGEQPGALPFQLLDHGTGYLAAAAALDGVRRQASEGGTHVRRVSLARTAHWITSAARGAANVTAHDPVDAKPWLQRLDVAGSTATAVLPPGAIDGSQLPWSTVGRYGGDDAYFAGTGPR